MTHHLSDLQNGETAVITKVKGYGAFRKRITEMGFVQGTTVKAIKKAPLHDPVEYELMGYRVSLRKSEAAMIEVISQEEAEALEREAAHPPLSHPPYHPHHDTLSEEKEKQYNKAKGKHIQVALVGNPNCGKTTLFNRATGKHERVGNYGGVTVDIKTAHFHQQDYRIDLTDLPGTYSISEYTPEELFVRKHLTDDLPDVVINVIDASNLERNLFLTTQLIDMNLRTVIALNMYDELQVRGDRLHRQQLSELLGIPIIPTVASKGKGIGTLLDKVIDVYEENTPEMRHIHINYGEPINDALQKINTEVKKHPAINDTFHSRYVALKLIEGDHAFARQIAGFAHSEGILQTAEAEIRRLEKTSHAKAETLVADAKYAFIRGALKETFQPAAAKETPKGYRADRILTHRWLGIPLFLVFMWALFQGTFTLGAYPMEWIDAGVAALSQWVHRALPGGMSRDLLVDGIIGGVGGVIVFLPNIVLLFLGISLMEDTGYLARAAFIMDKAMHRIGLHGKSFIPLLMGFGCGVPAIMATRTLDNRKDRTVTLLLIPFMSCSARLPVYVLLISAFFSHHRGLVLMSIYALGIVFAAGVAIVFNKICFKKADVPFVMELPPYRVPTLRNIGTHTWNRSAQYLSKMGTVILAASILIWALGYFPRNTAGDKNYAAQITAIAHHPALSDDDKAAQTALLEAAQASAQMEQSCIGRMGHLITPVIAPLGYDWKIGVSLLTGIAAKEIVVSTMGVLYPSGSSAGNPDGHLSARLRNQTHLTGPRAGEKVFTPLVAYSFMVFILLYFPCIAALAAIRREAGWKWALAAALYTTALAWMAAFVIYRVGQLFFI